jgi:hypothetical protein
MLIRLVSLKAPRSLNPFTLMKRKLHQTSSSSSATPSPSKRTAAMASRERLLQHEKLASTGGQVGNSQAGGTLPTIALNALEEQLKTLLLEAAKSIDDHDFGGGTDDATAAATAAANYHQRERLVLRWAGGWVRDKLLGITSHDIDTAINAMTGEAFVDRLRDYCDVPAHRERHALQPEDIGRLHTVPRNPDKSKHLATSTIRLCGLDVDFVNLRKETYTADSRNPVVEFGTAEEDALRRDATVNALFYNLHTGEVEDFVGGLEDLQTGLIRTPMEPLQTFLDDPLRVLRLVRFASRLGFKIDEEAGRVMADERVLGNLRVKISRERIGVELEKMLKGACALSGFRFMHRNLWGDQVGATD